MAETKKAEVKEKVYVSIPAKDMFDNEIVVYHNVETFEGGKTYMVEPDVAAEIERMLKVRQQADIRILQPKKDMKSIRQLEGSAARVATPIE